MERYLKMHPFVVTVSVIVGTRLLGPAQSIRNCIGPSPGSP
jgi:hypothetical protein